ncbi:MAG TPA: hypothetical protein VFO31_18825 [Vicinamibacterales bacterium]|nr:hypothetical protein [Vicinamibacterales bacterium]
MRPVARVLIAFIAWSGAFAVLSPIVFFVTVLLAGPHSSMLPSAVQPAVWLLGWAAVLLVPVLVARMAWRRTQPPSPPAP